MAASNKDVAAAIIDDAVGCVSDACPPRAQPFAALARDRPHTADRSTHEVRPKTPDSDLIDRCVVVRFLSRFFALSYMGESPKPI